MRKILVCAITLLLLGCFGRIIENRYYQLDYVPTPKEMLSEAVYPYTVRIKDFDVAEVYRRNNIVYRQSPFQLHFYNYEFWAVKPEYMVADVLFRHFEAAKLFSEVRRSVDAEEPDFTVSGTIRALEEYDNQDEWYAHLAMNMHLQENRTKKILWSREWSYRKKVSNFEPIYVVRGLSELLELINNEAIANIDSVMYSISGKPRAAVQIIPAPIEIEELPPPGEIE
ncbi:MAG: ABC-type transport auxiliary lipoprotein family protein [Fibromonadales bacterium]|nr:ABC-type transport auxiliary lipoprotein family protein [Fibromonadales bacterium]